MFRPPGSPSAAPRPDAPPSYTPGPSGRPSARPLGVGFPSDAPTLVDVLRFRAAAQPHVQAYTFLTDGDADEATITYGALDEMARAIAATLQDQVAAGDRALLMYPPGLDFVAAFLGCLYAGVVAVPIYPPRRNRHLGRLRAVAADADTQLVLTDSATREQIERAMAADDALGACRLLATDCVGLDSSRWWNEEWTAPNTIAFLQYTSGSTGTPKGVMVTHANVMANIAAIAAGTRPGDDLVGVSWLPMFHDMGLIGGTLTPLALGAPCVLMGPTQFLQNPMRWLRAMSRYRGTSSAAPNFALDLCSAAATPDDIATLDLSAWRVLFNGGEPVRAESLERFTATFAACGLRPEVHYPCFGLAESTLLVTGGQAEARPVITTVAADALEAGRVVPPAGGATRRLVGCGRAMEARVVIVDPDTHHRCERDTVGEIWVAGPSVAAGYWRAPAESQHTFGAFIADAADGDAGPFLRTGDLGFLSATGELFVTGRLKDLVIIRGRNIYPQDAEQLIERAAPFVRTNGCGVFAVQVEGQEALGAVIEADRAFARTLAAMHEGDDDARRRATTIVDTVLGRVRRAIAHELEVVLHTIAFVRPGSFPRTSSGKVQRTACRLGLERNELELLHVSRQMHAPLGAGDASGTRVIAPRATTDTANRIHAVVADWLREHVGDSGEQVSHDTSFTALGLDSLAAVSLAAKLERALDCRLPPEVLYDYQTIRSLAAYVDGGGAARRSSAPATAPTPCESAPLDGGLAPADEDGPPRPLDRYVARNQRLVQMKAQGNYFYETPISEQCGAWVVADGRRMLMLASYSYLGLLRHPYVEEEAKRAMESFGTGHHGARLLSGTTTLHRDLERRLADVLLADDAIVYTSGYTTNCATIPALVGEGDCVIGDEWNHASIVEGCRRSGAAFLTYPHADLGGLEARLQEAGSRQTLVVVDAVFSMDGDIVDLPGVVSLCRRYGALLMVDEAHSLGVLGARGRGIQEHFGLPADAVDVKMATLSKALPSSGGVVAGRQAIIDYLRHNARGYVFSGALPAVSVAAARAGLDLLEQEPERVARLWENVRRYQSGLLACGFDLARSCTPITPILCPDERRTLEMTRLSRDEGVYVVPVVYPAVPMNAPRLRTCVLASHTDSDIDFAVDTLERAGRRTGLIG